ncbi:uncharacterized protein N7479_006936 [Penicillium vulpinum]|uniref:Uncharacterized protein n=1 Tax=Penicillium vulpinum TaxID=29845 RepID=A0A1V6S2C3_9EURO|nr:uncharacterized protein N7479_006936 [Penicillium vulpinum]KAJ5959786.1 hypothetical protein N7479_006936 [Penicillium vulpinum]OQE08185.1 hypothetical protein PENVUL_c010G05858 [Penicillium vulpinum]
MGFCPFQRRASEPPKPYSELDYPLMDLSSLEGAPMVNPKFIVPPDTMTPRVHKHSRASIQYLLAKPLPPSPTSTDAISPTPNCTRLYDWSHNRSAVGGRLRRASARRRIRDQPDELSPNGDPQYERQVTPRRKHITNPPVRPRSFVPLTWLEDEKKWIVGEIYIPHTHDSRAQDDTASSRSVGSPISPVSPITPWQDVIQRLDEHIDLDNRLWQENLLGQPPPFDRHSFGQPHDTREDRVSSWVAATRRMHEDRRNWM